MLVSIHRGATQLVPAGATVLVAGDALTVFEGAEARDRLVERPAPLEPESAATLAGRMVGGRRIVQRVG